MQKDIKVKVPEDLTKVDENRQPCSIVLIGHENVGKSTISGQIMLQKKQIDDRQVEKLQKDAQERGRAN